MKPKNKPAKESKLVGRIVDIKGGYYAGHWGVITRVDREIYFVSGGSIGEGLEPVFSRDEFTVRRVKAPNIPPPPPRSNRPNQGS